jgi:hypothetical protein
MVTREGQGVVAFVAPKVVAVARCGEGVIPGTAKQVVIYTRCGYRIVVGTATQFAKVTLVVDGIICSNSDLI